MLKTLPEERCGCGPGASEAEGYARSIGYSDKELRAIPAEANLALGCGNPTALAGLEKGEVVVDLGAGAGFDCFLAATMVGVKGRIIGVDMTPEMVEKARANAKKHGVKNIEFRLGEIENLPVADNSVDAVISNCVINLSVDKPRVLGEISFDGARLRHLSTASVSSRVALLTSSWEMLLVRSYIFRVFGAHKPCVRGSTPRTATGFLIHLTFFINFHKVCSSAGFLVKIAPRRSKKRGVKRSDAN